MDAEEYSAALEVFETVIENHSNFAGIACYYSALCVIYVHGGGWKGKSKAKAFLKKALKLLDDEASRIMGRNQITGIINDLNRKKGQALMSNYFAQQNQGEAQMLGIHTNAIEIVIGSKVSAESLSQIPGATPDECANIYDALIKSRVLKDSRVSKKCVVGSEVMVSLDANGVFDGVVRRLRGDGHDTETLASAKGALLGWKEKHFITSCDLSRAFLGLTSAARAVVLTQLEEAGVLAPRELFRDQDGDSGRQWQSRHCHVQGFLIIPWRFSTASGTSCSSLTPNSPTIAATEPFTGWNFLISYIHQEEVFGGHQGSSPGPQDAHRRVECRPQAVGPHRSPPVSRLGETCQASSDKLEQVALD